MGDDFLLSTETAQKIYDASVANHVSMIDPQILSAVAFPFGVNALFREEIVHGLGAGAQEVPTGGGDEGRWVVSGDGLQNSEAGIIIGELLAKVIAANLSISSIEEEEDVLLLILNCVELVGSLGIDLITKGYTLGQIRD